jgi:hypothetical protein
VGLLGIQGRVPIIPKQESARLGGFPSIFSFGRGARIRTEDLLNPIQSGGNRASDDEIISEIELASRRLRWWNFAVLFYP